jgi:hypothetical protein
VTAEPEPAEHELSDLDGLIADRIAGGPDSVRRALQPLPASRLREFIATEVEHRAAVLLREARGSPVRAHDRLTAERARWRP